MRRPLALLSVLLMLLASCGGAPEPADPDALPDQAAIDGNGDADPAAFWATFREASEARRRGDPGAALLAYERALELQPGHPDSLYYVAQMRYERGELTLARERLQQLADIEPRALRPWQTLSIVEGSPFPGWRPDLAAAADAAARSLELYPSESRNHWLAARWAAYAGDLERATALLETTLDYNPGLWPAHLLRIWIAVRRGNGAVAAELSDAMRRSACGDAGARCAAFDPVHDILSAASLPATPGGDPAMLGDARPVDFDGDGRADADVVLGAGGSVLVLAAVDGPPGGPSAIPLAGVRLSGNDQPELLLASGAGIGAYRRVEGGWVAIDSPLPILVDGLTLPVVSAGDVDGDGLDDLLLANVPQADGKLAGLLLAGRPGGGFETRQTFAGPLAAAHLADLDADGDVDLLLARDVRADLVADSVLERVVGSEPPATMPQPVVSLWRNEGGRLTVDPQTLPATWSPVSSIATLDIDRDGRLDVALATGGPAPERPALDRLWLQGPSGFTDATERLGAAAAGATRQVWLPGDGSLVLVRGGDIAADPLRLVRVRPR